MAWFTSPTKPGYTCTHVVTPYCTIWCQHSARPTMSTSEGLLYLLHYLGRTQYKLEAQYNREWLMATRRNTCVRLGSVVVLGVVGSGPSSAGIVVTGRGSSTHTGPTLIGGHRGNLHTRHSHMQSHNPHYIDTHWVHSDRLCAIVVAYIECCFGWMRHHAYLIQCGSWLWINHQLLLWAIRPDQSEGPLNVVCGNGVQWLTKGLTC